MMTEQPPVDWTGLKPQAAGPRQYHGEGLGPIIGWRCPACGAENSSALADGCPACGSGKPGRHVGVDPVVTPEERLRRLQGKPYDGDYPTSTRTTVRTVQPVSIGKPTVAAYMRWRKAYGLTERTDSEEAILLFDAFKAGWEAARATTTPVPMAVPEEPVDDPELPDDPLPAAVPAASDAAAPETIGFPGTAEQRTILAALIYFRDQILPEAAEEVGTGQWLGLLEVGALISSLQKELE